MSPIPPAHPRFCMSSTVRLNYTYCSFYSLLSALLAGVISVSNQTSVNSDLNRIMKPDIPRTTKPILPTFSNLWLDWIETFNTLRYIHKIHKKVILHPYLHMHKINTYIHPSSKKTIHTHPFFYPLSPKKKLCTLSRPIRKTDWFWFLSPFGQEENEVVSRNSCPLPDHRGGRGRHG